METLGLKRFKKLKCRNEKGPFSEILDFISALIGIITMTYIIMFVTYTKL